MLPDPRETPFVDVETAARLTGLGRSKGYEQARRFIDTDGREGLPCIQFGRSLRVPVAGLWRLAGLNPECDEGPASDAEPVVNNVRNLNAAVDGHGTPAA